jgi:hypothetical protein
MKKCKDIENNLPLYLDNSLSGADKKDVEEHLKTCPQCTKALAQLSKTEALVNSLADVNPPPWFKQKIMARVREEAEKKSFVQKLFYPLRIKIPVQVFATVCIAVLAVYIYRAGEEQMKEVVPSPVIEVRKSQLPELKEKTVTDKEIQAKEQVMQKKGASREVARQKAVDTATGVNEQAAPDIKTDKYENAPKAESVALPEAALEKKKEKDILGTAMKASRAPQTQNIIIKPNILLKVSDIDMAVGEVEKLLVTYEAKNITRQIKQGKAVMTAELKNQKIKEFITRLKAIGWAEESNVPVADDEGNISLVMEIINN